MASAGRLFFAGVATSVLLLGAGFSGGYFLRQREPWNLHPKRGPLPPIGFLPRELFYQAPSQRLPLRQRSLWPLFHLPLSTSKRRLRLRLSRPRMTRNRKSGRNAEQISKNKPRNSRRPRNAIVAGGMRRGKQSGKQRAPSNSKNSGKRLFHSRSLSSPDNGI